MATDSVVSSIAIKLNGKNYVLVFKNTEGSFYTKLAKIESRSLVERDLTF